MNDIDTAILATDPVNLIYQKEYAHVFLCFCAFVNIMENKKTNLPNIFLLILKDEKYKKVFKNLCDLETDYEAFKIFLDSDPSLHRSKYIRNYINE
jgi:hypothetical protein